MDYDNNRIEKLEQDLRALRAGDKAALKIALWFGLASAAAVASACLAAWWRLFA